MTRVRKIVAALPPLALFLMAGAFILELACIYGLVRSGMSGAAGDVSIYLLLIFVLGVLIAIGLVVGNHLAKP